MALHASPALRPMRAVLMFDVFLGSPWFSHLSLLGAYSNTSQAEEQQPVLQTAWLELNRFSNTILFEQKLFDFRISKCLLKGKRHTSTASARASRLEKAREIARVWYFTGRSPSKHTFDASAACCMMRIREAPVGSQVSEEKPSANHQGLQGVASKT